MNRTRIPRIKHKTFLHRVSHIVLEWSLSEQLTFWRSWALWLAAAKRSKAADVKQLRLPL